MLKTSMKRTPDWIDNSSIGLHPWNKYWSQLVFLHLQTKKLVMKGNELELWIASSTTCNFITVQSNRWMLIINKHCTIFTTLIKRTLGIGPDRVRLIEVSLYLFLLYCRLRRGHWPSFFEQLKCPNSQEFAIQGKKNIAYARGCWTQLS